MSSQVLNRRTMLSGAGLSGLAFATSGLSVLGSTTASARTPDETQAALWRGMGLDGADGRSFQLGSGRAALTLVKLWASWCPACLSEMGSLAALAAAVPSDTLEVVLVSHPEYWREDLAAAQRRPVPFRMAKPSSGTDPGVIRAALTLDGAYDVPRSFVFRQRVSSIAWTHVGSMDWGSAATVSRLQGLAA